MSGWEVTLVTLGFLLAGALLGVAAHGMIHSKGGFIARIEGGFEAVKDQIEWPFRWRQRRAERLDRAVRLRLLSLSDADLLAIARRDPERVEKALKAARAISGYAEAFKPLGLMFGQIGQMFQGITDGIAAGVKEAGGMPVGLSSQQAKLAAEIIRSSEIGEHDQRHHRLSIKTDRIWDDFNPQDCRRCAWLENPADDEIDEAREEALSDFGPDTCTCGNDKTIQFPPHEPYCAMWNERTGNPKRG